MPWKPAERTPSPWSVPILDAPQPNPHNWVADLSIKTPDGYLALGTRGMAPKGVLQANAEFIVRACNAHDTLRASLELIANGGIIEPDAARLLLNELGLGAP